MNSQIVVNTLCIWYTAYEKLIEKEIDTMGTWSVSITGNDTAQDLLSEYSAAFFKYEPQEATAKIDAYVRAEICDETDEGEWCNYFYSLADYMWRKGILTDEIRNKAVEMIDSGFGLDIWAESGDKILEKRKQELSKFRAKLLSPMPPKKKIRPNAYTERIFEDGDIVAIQLQTAGKNYSRDKYRKMTDDEYQSYDGKYVLIQLQYCRSSWSSQIVPEVKDYWATFRLFDGVYDEVPCNINPETLKVANIIDGNGMQPCFYSCFYCESSMYYFRRRKYKVVGNYKVNLDNSITSNEFNACFGVSDVDSIFLSSMGIDIVCAESEKIDMYRIPFICTHAIYHFGRKHKMVFKSRQDYITAVDRKATEIIDSIEQHMREGGRLYTIRVGDYTIGFASVYGNKIDNIYVEPQFQRHGFGTQLLRCVLSVTEKNAQMIVPTICTELVKICEQLNLKADCQEDTITFTKV